MDQVHGNEIAIIDKESDPAISPTADALITRELNYGLAVLFADCAPLLLSSKQVSAAVHVGRKGLLADIVDKVVTQMRDMGAIGISAQIGPTICGKCYEVSEEMRDEAEDFMPIAASQTRRSAPSIDIPKAIISILSTAQIPGKWNGVCTHEDQSFFSYRRDKLTGRQAGVVVHGRR
jgi:YfiH family protein